MSLGTVVAGAMAVGVIAALPAASKPPKMTIRVVLKCLFLVLSAALLALDVHVASLGKRHPFSDGYLSLPARDGTRLRERGFATPRGRRLRWLHRALLVCLGAGVIAWWLNFGWT
ncbi:MAG TPA: hypothetical protein VNV25_06015 [Gemmatimonadaceae bacterium]|jgi:hypothetical protein|nr:hypothetical protein [Gemmatimonadaceae bacterium]